jgi:SOS-response transcriptional repressor LexA
MSTPAERLIQARTAAGCESAAEGATRAGVKYYTYVQHESGTRGISKDKAQKYGRAFGVEPSWLLYGRGKQERPRESLVPIIGKVGADAEGVIVYSTADDTDEFVPIAPGGSGDSVALKVVGHSMGDWAPDGSLIYMETQRTPPTPEMIGYPAVVETEDGRVLLKRLLKGSEPGVYDLESRNGPTLQDVRLRWAAEVTAIVPPRHARRIIQSGHERHVA